GLGSVVAGGKHYLYIFRNNSLLTTPPILANDNNATKYYDDGASIYNILSGTNTLEKLRVWRSCMWVGTPMTIPGRTFLATDAILKVRVETNYERYANKGYIVNKPSSNVGNSKNDWYNLYLQLLDTKATIRQQHQSYITINEGNKLEKYRNSKQG
ncbi:MAG: hypothetical protein QMC28_00580, partial [Flavobacteriales bacterium]